MKKILFTFFFAILFTACGSYKAYNSQLKQIELGMTPEQLITLMGNKYNIVEQRDPNNKILEYKDMYKNHWFFEFKNGQLNKWYKETEED